MDLDCDLRDASEILGVWRSHDVHVLCSSDDSPGIDRETADQNELNARLGESADKLIEGRFAQLECAAPVNRISW